MRSRSPLSGPCERIGERNDDETDGSPGPHQEPRDGGHRGHVRVARRGDPARVRPTDRLVDPPHPRPPRAGRRPHGRGVRPRHGPSRRGHGHERPGGHEHRHRPVRRLHGLRPDRGHHRPGAVRGDRQRRVPGMRHRRHHDAGHEAQLARHGSPGHPALRPRGVPRGDDGPAGPGARRRPQGRREPDDGLVLARVRRPARLQAQREGAPEADQGRGTPVVTTLMARGAFPDDHPQCLGMPGMHGNYTAVTSMQKCDLLIALGSRFDDRVTGKVGAFAPGAKVIHVDIDPAELGKVRRPDVPIVGDCRLVIEELVKAVQSNQQKREWPDLTPWWTQLREWQERYPLQYEQPEDGPLKPQYCIDMLRDHCPDDTIVVSGVGQHQMWSSQRWRFNHPNTWVNSGGLGTMGFAVPASIGAKVGKPDRMVWAIDGDGCFQMTAQELVTASAERIPVKVAILNNAYLGMVRQWQELFYEERYSEVYLSPDLPDYVKWAEAMGCVSFRVDTPEDVETTIQKANEVDDRPVVIDFRTDYREKVYPMVAAGTSNDDVILDPAHDRPGGRD